MSKAQEALVGSGLVAAVAAAVLAGVIPMPVMDGGGRLPNDDPACREQRQHRITVWSNWIPIGRNALVEIWKDGQLLFDAERKGSPFRRVVRLSLCRGESATIRFEVRSMAESASFLSLFCRMSGPTVVGGVVHDGGNDRRVCSVEAVVR